MGFFSNLKNSLLSLHIIQSLTCSPRVKALPVSIAQVAPQPSPSPSPGFQPPMMAQGNTTATATPSLPPPPPPRSIAELASPTAVALTIYGSIPGDVQLHPGGILYPPLILSISLAVLTSLGTIIYVIAKPDGGTWAESAKQRAMVIAFVFLLVAFVLRVLLLLPVRSLGLTGSAVLVGAAAAMAILFFSLWKKEEIDDPVAPEQEPAPDYDVENPSKV